MAVGNMKAINSANAETNFTICLFLLTISTPLKDAKIEKKLIPTHFSNDWGHRFLINFRVFTDFYPISR